MKHPLEHNTTTLNSFNDFLEEKKKIRTRVSRHALHSFLVLVKIVENQGHHQHRAQTQQTGDDNYSEIARRLLIWTQQAREEAGCSIRKQKKKSNPMRATWVWLTAHGGRSVVATAVRSSWHFSHMREMPDHINRWNSKVTTRKKSDPVSSQTEKCLKMEKKFKKSKKTLSQTFLPDTWSHNVRVNMYFPDLIM